jgi:hypothetical protein
MIARERVTTDGETARRVRARYVGGTSLRVKGQSFLASPAVPIVVQARTAFEGHVDVNTSVGVFASDSACAIVIGILEDFEDFPFVLAQSEIRGAARIEVFDTDAVKTTDNSCLECSAVTDERSDGMFL